MKKVLVSLLSGAGSDYIDSYPHPQGYKPDITKIMLYAVFTYILLFAYSEL